MAETASLLASAAYEQPQSQLQHYQVKLSEHLADNSKPLNLHMAGQDGGGQAAREAAQRAAEGAAQGAAQGAPLTRSTSTIQTSDIQTGRAPVIRSTSTIQASDTQTREAPLNPIPERANPSGLADSPPRTPNQDAAGKAARAKRVASSREVCSAMPCCVCCAVPGQSPCCAAAVVPQHVFLPRPCQLG